MAWGQTTWRSTGGQKTGFFMEKKTPHADWDFEIVAEENVIEIAVNGNTCADSMSTFINVDPEMMAEIMKAMGWTCTKKVE